MKIWGINRINLPNYNQTNNHHYILGFTKYLKNKSFDIYSVYDINFDYDIASYTIIRFRYSFEIQTTMRLQ